MGWQQGRPLGHGATSGPFSSFCTGGFRGHLCRDQSRALSELPQAAPRGRSCSTQPRMQHDKGHSPLWLKSGMPQSALQACGSPSKYSQVGPSHPCHSPTQLQAKAHILPQLQTLLSGDSCSLDSRSAQSEGRKKHLKGIQNASSFLCHSWVQHPSSLPTCLLTWPWSTSLPPVL